MQNMAPTLRYLFVLLFVGMAGTAFAQSGEIKGTVLDDNNEPVIGAIVQVLQGGISRGGAATDFDGNYSVKPLAAGRYDVRISYSSYKTHLTTGVVVSPDQTTEVNARLEVNLTELDAVTVTAYKIPLVDKYAPGGSTAIGAEEMEKMPTRTTDGVASTAAGVYANPDGGLNMVGGRSEGTLYIIDGVQVRGGGGRNIAQNMVDQVQVLTSGLSARYGDALGGVINITTKGTPSELMGGILLERSVDGFGHNLANFSLLGPLFSKRIDGVKKPVVGFALGVDVLYDEDRRPVYGGNYVLKEEVLSELQARPLVAVSTPTGATAFRPAAEGVRIDDMVLEKKRTNAEVFEGRLNGKLDFQLSDNVTLTFGANMNYFKTRAWIRSWTLYTPDAMPTDEQFLGRGFLRLTQRFGRGTTETEEEGEDARKPLISNAYYSLQADYQKDYYSRDNRDHGRNLFNYNYVGKFYTDYETVYAPGVDDTTGLLGIVMVTDRLASGVRYERSELNPILANYTTQYFNEQPMLPTTLAGLRASGALLNGDMPPSVYATGHRGGFANVGTPLTFYQYRDYDQFAVSADASFDLQPGKTRHSIEFGLYYQQRTERFYGADAYPGFGGNIWQYMRQLTNQHISLDKGNPILLVNGQRYTREDYENGLVSFSPFDTIIYNHTANASAQSTFDRNLRERLGAAPTEFIDVDTYDPETFSLDLFSPDELLNNGDRFVTYWGYDYLGNRQTGQVNFNDFFTKKDEHGNFTREVGAFRPNYIAGYLLDKFQFKDILFNVGVRFDRFDANTKVLKDPYSLYEVRDLASARNEVANTFFGGHPSNMGSDYVVYVNTNESTRPTVVGYRDGDDWYDPYGRRVEDPGMLRQYSNGRDPQPLLVDPNVRITDSTFDPNSSFTDYKPQLNVSPRISFSFPISDVALFYAHYDVMVQRPTSSSVFASPADYYFMTNNDNRIINNPNLKPQKMFDYEVGFQQQLTRSSALTISGFYRERKDMIQIRPYLYAWPRTYYTFGNRDFSTTKGLTLKYDLRRTSNLMMKIAYTLQFAEGSGSGTASANSGGSTVVSNNGLMANFISAGLPDLRYAYPLDIDSRHNLAVNLDYRYFDNEGPMIGNTYIFQNMGANLIFRTRSGEPYTRYSLPAPQRTVLGQLNGSRYPWHYNIDLRVDKDFRIGMGTRKTEDGEVARDPFVINAFVLIQNLLNNRDVININGYTGRPDDDGYLTSPQGIVNGRNQTNQQAFMDHYLLLMMDPYALGVPRRINVGLQFNF